MKRLLTLRKITIGIAVVTAVLAAILVGVQCFVNSPAASGLVKRVASNKIDANLDWRHLNISFLKHFPVVSVEVDTFSLTYPHDRFSSFDKPAVRSVLLDAGRGSELDTLAAFNRLSASARIDKFLFSHCLKLGRTSLEGLRVYAHKYGSAAANWDVFIGGDTEQTSAQDDSTGGLPRICLESVEIKGSPKLIYTAAPDTVFAAVIFDSLGLSGDFALDFPGRDVRVRDFTLTIDSLFAFGRLPVDTVGFGMERFDFRTEDENLFALELRSTLTAFTPSVARRHLPVALNSRFSFPPSLTSFNLQSCDIMFDGIPVSLDGKTDFWKHTNANVGISAPELNVRLAADAEDLMGRNPGFALSASGYAVSQEFLKYLPDSLGLDLSGRVNLSLDVRTTLDEIKTYRFENSRIKGRVSSPDLHCSLPADTLSARLSELAVDFASNSEGISFDVRTDSVFLNAGKGSRLRSSNLHAGAALAKVEYKGQLVPELSVNGGMTSAFVRAGKNMLGLKDLEIGASMRRVVHRDRRRVARRRLAPDGALPDYLSEKDFRKSDFSISLDSSLVRFFDNWNPGLRISVGKAFVASPMLPLRTRLNALDCSFDGRNAVLDTLSIACGTSDMAAKGRVSGLRPLLTGHRTVVVVDASVSSNRLDINELIAAGKLAAERDSLGMTVDQNSNVYDESFVVDSLDGSSLTSSDIKLFVLPANVRAHLGVNVDSADFLHLRINPMAVDADLRERTLRINDASLKSNCGEIGLRAFYSTRTKKDISAGVDVRLDEMSVGELLKLLPSMDDMMPALKSFDGRITCQMAGTASLDTNMNVIMPSVDGMLRIQGKDMVINDMSSLRSITRLLLFRDLEKSCVQSLSVEALISDNKLQIFPFELAVDRYRLALQGTQNFDKTMSYHVTVMRSPLPLPFGINLRGSLDKKIRFSLCLPKFRAGRIPVYSERLDTVQLNVAHAITDIYRRGVEEVRRYNYNATRNLGCRVADDLREEYEPLTPELDSMLFERIAEEQSCRDEEEISAVISESDAGCSALLDSLRTGDAYRKENK